MSEYVVRIVFDIDSVLTPEAAARQAHTELLDIIQKKGYLSYEVIETSGYEHYLHLAL